MPSDITWIDWAGLAGTVLTFIGIVFTFYQAFKAHRGVKRLAADQARESARLAEVIPVIMQVEGKEEKHKVFELRREAYTRAEVQGLLRASKKKSLETEQKKEKEGYDLAFTASPQFREAIDQIKTGSGPAQLVIPCSQAELDQFITEPLGEALQIGHKP